MKTFWIRTASATVYALLFIGSIYSGRLIGNNNIGIAILTAFALFAALGCSFEYYRIAEMQENHPNKPLGYFFTTIMVLVLSLLPLCYGEADLEKQREEQKTIEQNTEQQDNEKLLD